jgi:CheY-specific phosphatase CheX
VSLGNVDALLRLSSCVLADCAFLLTEPADGSIALDTDLVHAVVEVTGARSGSLALSVPRPLAAVVAADMLGVSPDDPEVRAQAEGAVAELANVLVGAVVERFCHGEACELGLPKVHRGELPVTPRDHSHTALLLADSGDLIRVIWTVDAGAPA